MQKRILSIILALAMMFSLAATISMTASAETSGDFEYEVLEDGTVEITGYTGNAKKLEIPSEIDGKTVTFIGYFAFYDCDSLTSVTIPSSVTSIGYSAFCDCESLANVTIPDKIASIGSGAFYNTALYNNKSNWEDDVLYIGNCLISGKYELYNEETEENDVITETKGDYKIKDDTKLIADCAFLWCRSLTSITIPNSVTRIGDDAFRGCESLTSVTIPSSATRIGEFAFSECPLLTNVTIQSGVTIICDYAFYDCDSLTSVSIPDSVTIIGYSAFDDCNSLASVTIPSSVTSIYDCAFGYYFDEDEEESLPLPDFHIYCYKGTAGEQYAIYNDFDYTLLKEPTDTPSVIITQPTSGSIKKTENSDGTITLTATAYNSASFANWVITGDFEIVEGSLYSETITIRPLTAGIEISTVFDVPSTGIYGDANGDGNIDMLDVLLIRKYVAKQPVKPNLKASDVTADGNIDMLDVLLIRKYIAKQPVILGPQI